MVYDDPEIRRRYRTPFAAPAELSGARLVVYKDRDSVYGSQALLDLDDPAPVEHRHSRGKARPSVASHVLGGDGDPGHPMGKQDSGQVGDPDGVAGGLSPVIATAPL